MPDKTQSNKDVAVQKNGFQSIFSFGSKINFIDLLTLIFRYKYFIICVVFMGAYIAVNICFLLTNIYRSEATIVPREEKKGAVGSNLLSLGGFGAVAGNILGLGSSGSLEKFEVILKSRIISRKIYNMHKYKILPEIYDDMWDAKSKKWAEDVERPPSNQNIIQTMSSLLTVYVDTKKRILRTHYDHQNPIFAHKMVMLYLNELSEILREEKLKDAIENKKFLNQQLEHTSDALLKEKIYILLAQEIEEEIFAKAQKPYGFQIIDPPVVSDLGNKIGPRRSIICILSVFASFFLAIFLIFIIEYIRSMKNREPPEKLKQLLDSIKM